jgi:ParB family chromosome partitioning protein
MRIDSIIVGERTRKDMGDLDALAASIADVGLINPITVDEDGRLLAGARRLAACKLLGLKEVEVRIRKTQQ